MSDSYVCSGAVMRCTMGTSPANLTVLPVRTVNLTGPPMANISDHKSMVNLAPFGLCRSLGFPPTAAATAAAHGHLTPMPCMHNTPAPWMGGKMDYLIKGQPALLKSCKCQCMWGGTISLVTDGQVGEGTQYVQKKPKTGYSPKSLELKKGAAAQPPDRQLESKEQTEKAAALDFAEKTWNTVSSTIADISHKKQEFVDYVCDYVSDYVEQKAITAANFIEQKQNALAKAIGEANQFWNKAYDDIKEEIKTFLKTDKIILWDAYWEKSLAKKVGEKVIYEENGTKKTEDVISYSNTKLRFLPQQLEVELNLVFYFKYDDTEHKKGSAEFVLNIEVPETRYTPKKYKITGEKILKFVKDTRDGRDYYKCSIKSFSSDLTKADFIAAGFTEMP